MKETTRRYMVAARVFATVTDNVERSLDVIAAQSGAMSAEDEKMLAQLKAAFRAELEPTIEKIGVFLETLISEEIILEALKWYESPAGRKFEEVRPALTHYANALDIELGQRLEARLKILGVA